MRPCVFAWERTHRIPCSHKGREQTTICAYILATRAIARSPVHHGRTRERVLYVPTCRPPSPVPTIHQREGTYECGRGELGDRGLKTTFKNVGYRRAEGSLFPLGTRSDRYFPFRRGIRDEGASLPLAQEAREATAYLLCIWACSRLKNPIRRREWIR